ncbi:hypothetical protein [uncultured Azohydromonas sp.]|jgi:hypothetical protein|uniref:hypothetical protein n=1 Tax=uncultured Azohydromonas sp. TaxID=487342 RepID=UPI002605AEF4|nr:hypothetical protein [uncultured Azohydromonas sp.]
MDNLCTAHVRFDLAPPEYATAFAELERLASRGQLTLAQLRREIRALRERFTDGRPVALCMPRQQC